MSGVRPSPELLAVARRWIAAIPNRRPDELRNLLTDHDHLLFVGTGDDELWRGGAVRDGVAEFFGVIPDLVRHEETFAEAHENGGTGWAVLNHELIFANQPDRLFNVRTTLVFVLEGGTWRIVHRHGSVPIPNATMTGTEQTAIADLVAAARQGFALDQRAGFASVMFTDIVNSSRIASVMGDRLWSSEVARHFAALRRIIEDADGQFVKSLGDGTMSSFPDPVHALRAAQAILTAVAGSDGPSIALRIGIHTGPVVQTDADFFGNVVNKAARITSVAEPGEIRVSDATRDLVEPGAGLAFSLPIATVLKGFDGDHTTFRLEWRA
ncbi:adenylate/guanylate cyclase domain-containing protein [Thiosulfatihalobacter marinus]|uniref:adenylate/guanylate cyclase domain-containing protein n=1 Tax=Thiosulfatihalobacter marinus TaxID=2792481 RepID=UPI0018D9C369|nr:adenylate/guanylate cyclase domain-containing protein [Thiosulfatihalobacter marinus]